MSVNWERIAGRTAVYMAATPENPIHVKTGFVNVMKVLDPDTYARIEKKIQSGAYILEA